MDRYTLGATAILVLGTIWICGATYWLQKLRATNWRRVEAQILSIYIPPHLLGEITWRTLSAGASKQLAIAYSYRFENHEFTGTAVTISDTLHMPAKIGVLARQLNENWRTTKKILIYVDPEKPSRAFACYDVALWPFLIVPLAFGFAIFLLTSK